MKILSKDDISFVEGPLLSSMNYLNEISDRFPDAISFASGRPNEESFNVKKWTDATNLFSMYFSEENNVPLEKVERMICQYGATKGMINKLISRQLLADENIYIDPKNVLVTNGAQEGMAVFISCLFKPGKDVLLVIEATYVGIIGLANIHDIEVVGIKTCGQCIDLNDLVHKIRVIEDQGKTAKAIYVVPDFSNPLGHCFPLPHRKRILDICCTKNIIILEDNPYGMFRFEGDPIPTLKSLDSKGIVVYIGTFSKTVCPGLRVGYLVADQMIEGGGTLIDLFTKIKSFISVNTGQIAQSIVGSLLLDDGCSLKSRINPLLNIYRNNRDEMLKCLSDQFCSWREIEWSVPEGGFFIVLKLPFSFNGNDSYLCARDFGVICVPTSFFSLGNNYNNYIRLSFSHVKKEDIAKGIYLLAQYLKGRQEK